jgi:hypothetical protein
MRDLYKPIGLVCVALLMFIAGMKLPLLSSTTDNTDNTTNKVKVMPQEGEIYTDYEPKDFKKNYEIDLKQDGYLIKDIDGEVYYVPHFDLEDWFMRINL